MWKRAQNGQMGVKRGAAGWVENPSVGHIAPWGRSCLRSPKDLGLNPGSTHCVTLHLGFLVKKIEMTKMRSS